MKADKIYAYIHEMTEAEIIVIDGPTGSGKTRLLNRIKSDTSKTFAKMSSEEFCSILLEYLHNDTNTLAMAKDRRFKFEILCIEDIDVMLSNKLESSYCLAEVAQQLVKSGASVILTGIDLNKRMTKEFFSKLKGPQYFHLE